MAFQTMSGIPKVTSTANFYSNTNPLLQSRGIGGFAEPSALFGAGEQGAWWDFSDLDSMYQEDTCNTKAALESTVGFIADKRLQTRGPEVIGDVNLKVATAPGVNNGTWNAGLIGVDSALVGNGHAILNCPGGSGGAAFNVVGGIGTTAGKWYEITLFVNKYSGNAAVYFSSANTAPIPQGASGLVKIIGKADGGSVGIKRLGVCYLDISYFSVKELIGNHLVQATAGARPTLSRRYNKLLATRGTLTDGVGFSSVNLVGVLQPDGSSLLTRTSTAANAYTVGAVAAPVGTTLRYRQRVKYSLSAPYFGLRLQGAFPDRYDLVIDLTSGAVAFSAGVNYTAANIKVSGQDAQGFYIVQFDITAVNSAVQQIVTGPTTFANAAWEAATATLISAYASQPDVRLTADANLAIPEYQYVDTASVYDTLGFPAYLLFDGATKWMQSASAIDFTATQQLTTIYGITRLVTTQGAFVEHSINGQNTDGTFRQYHDAANYQYGIRGTVAVEVNGTNYPGTPETAVLSNSIDMSQATPASRDILTRNGVTQGVGGTSGATTPGNFTSQITYVGALLGGTANWFNGRMFGMIIRGAATNANDLQMTNKWMGSKCGLFF